MNTEVLVRVHYYNQHYNYMKTELEKAKASSEKSAACRSECAFATPVASWSENRRHDAIPFLNFYSVSFAVRSRTRLLSSCCC